MKHLALLLALAALTSGMGVGEASIGSSVGDGFGDVRAAQPTLPTGVFAYVFDADDIDGNNSSNSAYTVGGFVTSWVNDGGSVAHNADKGQAGSTSTTYKPLFEESAINGHDALGFDGVGDTREIENSAVDCAFIHQTGVFHMFVVFRQDTTTQAQFLSSTTSTNNKGFAFNTTALGKLHFRITRGVGGTDNGDLITTAGYSPGTWLTAEAKGDGTTLSVAKDFGAYETLTFTNKPFATGNATNSVGIGTAGAATTQYLDGSVALVLISTTALSAAQRAQVRAVVAARYGI